MNKLLCLTASAALAAVLSHAAPAAAQTDALAGTVTSAEEGAMEGVLVSAKRSRAHTTSRSTRTARRGPARC